MHAAPRSAEWRALAAQAWHEQWGGKPAFGGLVRVDVGAWMPRPQARPKDVLAVEWKSGAACYRRQKPDVDNIAKAVLDALVTAGVLVDDSQVCVLHIGRVVTDARRPARVEVRVMMMQES
jgi:Holliday junction resolvase RusA-like endonuclease